MTDAEEAKGAEEARRTEQAERPGAPRAGRAAAPGRSTDGDGGTGPTRPRRRQARGEARIAQLLEAAASVFGASGYTGASTNAIAREAGVSPGTLYQFFPNKEAIAVELGDQLMHRWRDTYGAAFVPSNLELPLDRMLDAALDPLIDFNCENPAFTALMHGSEIPGVIARKHDTLHATMLARTEQILGAYLPDLPAEQVARIAAMVFAVFQAGVDLIMAHEDAEREAYTKELKAVLFGYLDPLVGDGSRDTEPTRHGTP